MRKVLGLVLCQLAFNVLLIYFSMISPSYREFNQRNWWMMIIWGIIGCIGYCTIVLCPKTGKVSPYNWILFSTTTLGFGMLLSIVCSFVEPYLVFIAILSCGIIVLGLTIYGLTAKIDYSMGVGIVIVLFLSLILFIIGLCSFDYDTYTMCYVYGSILIYGIYILIDVLAIRGHKGHGIGLDYYVAAAVMMYVDIVMMFIYILRAVKGNN